MHPDDQERAREALLQHLGGSAPAYQLELRLRHAQGDLRLVQDLASSAHFA